MKINSLLLLICVLIDDTLSQTAKTNRLQDVTSGGLFESNINHIIEDILQRQWKDEDSPCLQKTIDILRNVKNHTLWATWVWDSMQSPTGVLFGSRNQLGNFDECVLPPWIKTHPEFMTQYCLVDIVLTDKKTKLNDDPYTTTELYIKSITKNKLAVNELTWGLCMPAICKPNSIKKLAQVLLSNSHLGFALPQTTINVHSCQNYNEHIEVSYGYYATLMFTASMILLTLLLTNYYEKHRHRHTGNESYDLLLAKAFSIKENVSELFKNKNDEIRSLNWIKVMSAYLAVYLHFFVISYAIGCRNTKSFDRLIESNNYNFIFHADIGIETFIVISGILLMKSFLDRNKPINVVDILIKRYFRLSFVSMVIILYVTQVLKYHGAGPLAPKTTLFEVETCRESWWSNLLTINNYMDFSRTCHPVTWSIACDFHLTIIGTAIYWLYQKNKRLGLIVFTIGAISSIMLPTLESYRQGLHPVVFSDLEKIRDLRKSANLPSYLHSHWHTSSYFVGLAFGFLMSVYKPSVCKKLSQTLSVIIFNIGSGLCLFLYLSGGYLIHNKYSEIETAIFVGTKNSLWAIGTGLIILSCEYGTVPLVSNFLCWRGFGPLSKLSYGVYLTHWPVLMLKSAGNTVPDTLHLGYLAIDTLGVFTFCCGLAFVIWLVFEAPMNNTVSIILRTRSNKDNANGTANQNGVTKDMKKIT